MQRGEQHLCEKCGKDFLDIGTFASHLCVKSPTPSSKRSKGQLGDYKCPFCNEIFSKPCALKRHFRTHDGDLEPRGPFPCKAQDCLFSSNDRQEYQAHVTSTHNLTLFPCTLPSCRVAFSTHGEMESHWRMHMPFHCPHCQFVSLNAKQLTDHYVEHSGPPAAPQGEEMPSTTAGLDGSSQPVISGRPKRKRKPNPLYVTSDLGEAENQGHSTKRRRKKQVENNELSAVTNEADVPPSKDYLAEGSEQVYRTHTCPKCRRCFKMRSHLQEHLHLHYPDPSLQCSTCQRYFTSKSKLRIHMLREAGEKIHRCHLCEYSAVEQNSVHRHLATVHADEVGGNACSPVYPCPTCGQIFHQSGSLKAHMKTHNALGVQKPITCFQEGCTFQSSSRKVLLAHATKVHGVKAVGCRHHACNAVFRDEKDMEDHRRTHLAYHCSCCDFSCSNKTAFLQHQRQGHPGSEELRCDFCPFTTFNPVAFEQHVGHLHANEKTHHCPQCSFVTAHKRGLRRHMIMHSGEKPHKCNQCDFRCRDESYLSKHMLTHSDDKNFMCSECGYITKWKHYLNVHMRKHAGDLRYQCDQCSYRCHRMDQLNSHKLRHQTKSLMCEICAYACKRKYELRNHMLAKHSGERQQPVTHQCKYCSYTTCYRQALQNHENCKHTKLREFRCALCSYSSFSSVSLFLHKRKAHGYVPGDKAWQETYAAKEKERNSIEFMQDFYQKPPGSEQCEQTIEAAPVTENQVKHLVDSADQHTNQQTSVTSSGGVAMVDVYGAFPQEAAESVSVAAPSVNSPEEYCTLVLTTLPNTEYVTTDVHCEVENSTDHAHSTTTLNDARPDTPQQSTGLSMAITNVEEDGVACDEGVDGNQSDSYENDIRLNDISGPENDTQTSAVDKAQSRCLESEGQLKAMRKQDRDQVDAMVLEGRVQMLVVQNEDVYHCDKCSYVTRKETALKNHCQSTCRRRLVLHKCSACGAQFKQRRGLDTHIVKKCPARPRKARAFLGESSVCQTVEKESDGSKQSDERTPEGPTEPPPIDNPVGGVSGDQQSTQQGEEACTSQLTNCGSPIEKATVSGQPSSSQHKTAKVKKRLKVKVLKQQNLSDKKKSYMLKNRTVYSKKDGKFICKRCSFSSVNLATVKRHCSSCRTLSRRKQNQQDNEPLLVGKDSAVDKGSARKVPTRSKVFSCSRCPFRCNQKRALDSHVKRGCLKPDEIQCQLCAFVAKSQQALTNHVSLVHGKNKSSVIKPKRLHCEHCNFTCKQERCMTQHVALSHNGVKPHGCRYCPFSTTRRYRLEEHESLHTGIGRHSCDKCSKSFGTVTKLHQHKTRVHDRQPSHFCSLCDFSGYTLDDVRRHNLRCHTGELPHACAACEARFSSDAALRNHCKRVHQLQGRFPCLQCGDMHSNEARLKAHAQSEHSLPLKCTTCEATFDTKESLEAHQRTHLAHRCQSCPFATKTKQMLVQHLLDEHEEGPAGDKPLKCGSCEFACRHQLVFEQHLRSHGGKRLYKCTDCEYSTRNKQKITWHVRTHTGEKPYSCQQCSYTCSDPSRLKFHMRVHQEEKRYLCPECGYKCKWTNQLKYHMTKHTGEKPYACEECDYRTNRADALRVHRTTQHCDVRSYVCEKCGKAFKTSFILKTHQRQHSDERRYACGLCSKAFRWPAGLRHHYLSHTKQKPFRCRHCSYTAKQKFQVVKHLQRRHPEVPAELGVVRDSRAATLTLREALRGAQDGGEGEEEDEEEQDRAHGKAPARELGEEEEETQRVMQRGGEQDNEAPTEG